MGHTVRFDCDSPLGSVLVVRLSPLVLLLAVGLHGWSRLPLTLPGLCLAVAAGLSIWRDRGRPRVVLATPDVLRLVPWWGRSAALHIMDISAVRVQGRDVLLRTRQGAERQLTVRRDAHYLGALLTKRADRVSLALGLHPAALERGPRFPFGVCGVYYNRSILRRAAYCQVVRCALACAAVAVTWHLTSGGTSRAAALAWSLAAFGAAWWLGRGWLKGATWLVHVSPDQIRANRLGCDALRIPQAALVAVGPTVAGACCVMTEIGDFEIEVAGIGSTGDGAERRTAELLVSALRAAVQQG